MIAAVAKQVLRHAVLFLPNNRIAERECLAQYRFLPVLQLLPLFRIQAAVKQAVLPVMTGGLLKPVARNRFHSQVHININAKF
jgi:hypothetical protein